jgi:hypothetical protein
VLFSSDSLYDYYLYMVIGHTLGMETCRPIAEDFTSAAHHIPVAGYSISSTRTLFALVFYGGSRYIADGVRTSEHLGLYPIGYRLIPCTVYLNTHICCSGIPSGPLLL